MTPLTSSTTEYDVMDADERLHAVAHALTNLTREGRTFASGTIARFPPPGLRLHGEKHDLQLPLSPAHAQAIIKRSKTRGKGITKATTWEVDVNAFEIRNTVWDEFVVELVDAIRQPLGIASDVKVKPKLNRLVLHAQGGRFDAMADKARKKSFATLVVVLPGDFHGGDFVLLQRGKKPMPGPCLVYDVAYVAFYNDCAYRANPVTSGSRVCLMYDLVTTTITDVPLSASAKLLQFAVNDALAQLFGLNQTLKLSERASNRVVYVVTSGGAFEELSHEESEIVKSLETFCATTNGGFALYLAKLECQRVTREEEECADVTLWLQTPWLRYNAPEDGMASTIRLGERDVIAPDTFWVALNQAELEIEEVDDSKPTVKTQWHAAHALVVQETLPAASQKKRKAREWKYTE